METLPQFDTLWDDEDPAGTEAAFRSLLPRAAESGDAGYHAQLLSQIARTQGLQGRFEDALRTLAEAESLPGLDHTSHIRLLLERGRVLNSSGDPAASRSYFLGAWHLACEVSEDAYAVDAAHMLGIVETDDEGRQWNARALMFSQTSSDPAAQRWQGPLYNNTGWDHHDQGHYEEALACFQQALEAYRRTGKEREVQIASWCVARALRSLGQVEEALAMQEQNLRALARTTPSNGHLHQEIGECLLALGRSDEARPYFARAYALLSSAPASSRPDRARLERLRTLGE